MGPVSCRAYARAAASRSRSYRYQAEGVLIIGAASLGVQIPIFITNFKSRFLSSDEWFDQIVFVAPVIAVALIITFGLMFRERSENFDLARQHYEQVAKADLPKNVAPLIERRKRGALERIFGVFGAESN